MRFIAERSHVAVRIDFDTEEHAGQRVHDVREVRRVVRQRYALLELLQRFSDALADQVVRDLAEVRAFTRVVVTL